MALDVFANTNLVGTSCARLSFQQMLRRLMACFDAFDAARFPILCAVQGGCIGGALDLAAARDLRYASELIAFIRETQGSDWFIEVAAYPEYHPQQRYAKRDLEHFAAKVKAGANSAITQFFFNPDAYFHFVDEVRALGVDVPIVPGIMPFHNYARIAQFAQRDGIEIPRWVALASWTTRPRSAPSASTSSRASSSG